MGQMLQKAITGVRAAPGPAAAAEMVLVRIAYVADLPTPDEAIKMLEQNGGGSPVVSGGSAARNAPAGAGGAAAPGRLPPPPPPPLRGGGGRAQIGTPAPAAPAA